MAILEPAFNHAISTLPPRPTSGMVEMQDQFGKLRRVLLLERPDQVGIDISLGAL